MPPIYEIIGSMNHKKRKWTQEESDSFIEFINLLRELDKQQKHMTEQEKRDNSIMIHTNKGDVYY